MGALHHVYSHRIILCIAVARCFPQLSLLAIETHRFRIELYYHTKIAEYDLCRHVFHPCIPRNSCIGPSNSLYRAPILFAKKSDSRLKLYTDYRALNKTITVDSFPIPIIDEL